MQCRDWAATLWPASYMGVAFFFERDEMSGGRALAVHEFPGRDTPYVEDNGAKARWFEGTAYVAGDDADTQAAAFAEKLDTRGPGTLVTPFTGPVSVHCDDWKRSAEKDQLGYIAFSVKFVRDGAATALISIPLLGQGIFDAADAMAHAVALAVSAAMQVVNAADYVVSAPVRMVEMVAASIALVRTTVGIVDADIAAQVAAAETAITTAAALLITPDGAAASDIANLLAAAPPLDESFTDSAGNLDPVATLAAVIIATIRLLADGMAGNADGGAGAMLTLALDYPAPAASAGASLNAQTAAANAALIVNLARLAALTAWCEGLARGTYPDRPSGVAARAAAAERLGQELGYAAGAANANVYTALQDLQGATVAYLTNLIADLAPVVTVTAPQAMPALWWAWRLYGDPTRAVDLALRNKVVHPSFMPLSFQALAPGFAAPASLPTAWPAP